MRVACGTVLLISPIFGQPLLQYQMTCGCGLWVWEVGVASQFTALSNSCHSDPKTHLVCLTQS